MSVQRCVITDWLPEQLANGNLNSYVRQKRHDDAQKTVFIACRQAQWAPVKGHAKLTITLVFGLRRKRDWDNLYSRCKGLIDGVVKGGWIEEDNTDVLDLKLNARTDPGRKATILELEPVLNDDQAQASAHPAT